MSKHGVVCPYCGQYAVWCENKEIYGRNYGKSYMCYLCRDCDAYVGCHNNTKVPLGVMANKELRELRKQVHAKIDPLWKSGDMPRRKVYAMLSREIGKPYHTGESDEQQCLRILNLTLDGAIK